MNEKIDFLISSLEDAYDIIIIDAVPVNPVSDTYFISKFADITLFVVRHAVTPKINVQMLDEDIAMQRLRNVNIVFNGVKKRGFGASGYGYAYGYGYTSNIGYGYFSKNKSQRGFGAKV
jgi:Mrp family chromosome partitioning ATPase